MNCIDCKWAIQWDKERTCKKASPEIKTCEWQVKAHRCVKKQVEEMLEG